MASHGINGTKLHEVMSLEERLQYGRDLLDAYQNSSDKETGRELTKTYRSELDKALKSRTEELDDRIFSLVTIAYNTALNQTNRRYKSKDRSAQESLRLRSREIQDVFGNKPGYNRATGKIFAVSRTPRTSDYRTATA